MKSRLARWTIALLFSVLIVGIGSAQDQAPTIQFTPIADGGALGLYIQSPTQLPDGRYAFLAKPYDLRELVKQVRRLLDRPIHEH